MTGMVLCRRVDISRALVADPEFIICAEVTSTFQPARG